MTECPIYFIDPTITTTETSLPPESGCMSCKDCCNCGYVQFESLLPYLKEIRASLKGDIEESTEFEFRLREQIIEISRLFDIEAGIEPGYFSKSHYETTRIYPTNGTRFIKIPEFVSGTLQVRTTDNILLDSSSYGFRDGFLIYLPCEIHVSCGCRSGCGQTKHTKPQKWPNSCYQITARWGRDCADMAIQMAVRDYLIESYRMKDPVVVSSQGLPISRGFQVPHSWSTYLKNFKAKRALYSQFAFA